MNKEETLTDIVRKVEWGQMPATVAFDKILQLFSTDKTQASFNSYDFAEALKEKFGESLISEEGGEEDPYNWWLHDVTVQDIVDFAKEYFAINNDSQEATPNLTEASTPKMAKNVTEQMKHFANEYSLWMATYGQMYTNALSPKFDVNNDPMEIFLSKYYGTEWFVTMVN